ncbi:hypothetical protein DRQ50_04065 [bacterium]|nr:MAG: hypothetical protein DRQ50_04065 [bacterium]
MPRTAHPIISFAVFLTLTVSCATARAQDPCFDYDLSGWSPTGSIVLPGGALDVAGTADGYLLVGGPDGLYTCDLNDPGAPTVTGYLHTESPVVEVATDGVIVAALTADDRLLTGVRVAPGTVSWSGEISLSFASRLALENGLLVFLQGNAQLATMDLSDPKTPSYLGWVALPEISNDLAVANGLAFLASGSSFVLVYDLSQPAQPQLVGSAGRFASGTAIAVEYPRVHVANVSKVVTYDASQPSALVELGDSSRLLGFTNRLAADRGLCLAASQEGHLVHLTAPVDTATSAMGHTLLETPPTALDVVAGNAVVALPDGTIHVYNPAQGNYPEVKRVLQENLPAHLVVADGLLYALDPDYEPGPGLTVSVLAPPPDDGVYLGAVPYFGTAQALDVRGDRLVLATNLTSLALVDISNPGTPLYISQRGQDVDTDDVAILDLSFCALGRDDFGAETLVVYDQATSGALRLASALRMPYGTVQVIGLGNRALVRARFEMNGLLMVDCRDPRSAAITDWVGTEGSTVDVVARGRYAYVLAEDGHVDVVDLSDPYHLDVVQTVELGVSAVGGSLAIHGGLLLVAESFRGMTMVDISTPEGATVAGAAWVPVTGDLLAGAEVLLFNDPLYKQRGYLPAACGALSAAGPPSLRSLALDVRPNPFNPRTELFFELSVAASVDLEIFDLRGRLVRRLLAGESRSGGTQRISWDGLDEGGHPLASAVYLARVRAGTYTGHAKLVIVR